MKVWIAAKIMECEKEKIKRAYFVVI